MRRGVSQGVRQSRLEDKIFGLTTIEHDGRPPVIKPNRRKCRTRLGVITIFSTCGASSKPRAIHILRKKLEDASVRNGPDDSSL
jgi:hypothetical protein